MTYEIPEITIDEAKRRLDAGDAVFLDVRDPGSHDAARIPGSIRIGDDNVHEFVEGADKTKDLVVYCYHGHSSMGATAWLLEQGFRSVQSMTGGFESWRGVHEHQSGPAAP